MSNEQVIIDREAPPWAQRLQTDLNGVLARMDRRMTAMRDGGWRDGGDLNVVGLNDVTFSVPEEARVIKVEGAFRPDTDNAELELRFGPSHGNYHSGATDYFNGFTFGISGAVTSGSYGASTAAVSYFNNNTVYSHFKVKITRGSSHDKIFTEAVCSGYTSAVDLYTIHRTAIGPAGSGPNRFFQLLPSPGIIGEMIARVEYRT